MKNLFCVMLLLLLCGCTHIESETSSKPSMEQGEIRLVCEEGMEGIDKLTIAFENENPQIKITVVKTDKTDDFTLATKALLSSEQKPTLILTKAEHLHSLEDYFLDLSSESLLNSALPNTLSEVGRAGEIIAMPAEIEGIGFVYDKSVFEKASINPENINSVERLAATAEYLSEKLSEFQDFDSVFAKPDEDTEKYLLNIVVSQEVSSSLELEDKELEFTFAESFKTLLTLLQNHSNKKETARSIIALQSHKEVDKTPDFDILPISVLGASQDSIILNVPTYWAVSKNATKEEQRLAKSFLSWVYTSETGNAVVADTLKWLSPFDNAAKTPDTNIAKTVLKYALSGKTMPYVLNGLGQEIYNQIRIALMA